MVDLVAAGRSRREAAEKAAKLCTSPGPDAFRRHYRALERSGQLPKPSSHISHKVEALKGAIHQEERSKREARGELVAEEEKARAMGMDLDRDVGLLFSFHRQRYQFLDDLLEQNQRDQADWFRRQGVTDPDEAARQLIEAYEERQKLRELLDVLRKVQNLRSILCEPQ